MPNVEIGEQLYKEMSDHIDKIKKENQHRSHTIKDFVNIAIKDKIDMDEIDLLVKRKR